MTDEELKKKCTERARIFQQAMESCKSSNPMDCIEWFADRIAELEKENTELKKDNSEWEKASDKWKSVYELTNKQLTKAKVALRKVVDYLGQFCSDYPNCVIEAEKILKEE